MRTQHEFTFASCQESSNLVSHKTAIPSPDLLTCSQQCSDSQPANAGISGVDIWVNVHCSEQSSSQSGDWLMQLHHLG